jgi:non-ribosomal peptide synthetase component F
LFQVMFDFHNAAVEVLPWPNLRLSWADSEGTTAKFDLTLFLFETPRGLQGRVEYATDLFEARTIERLVTSLQTLLQSVAADVEQKVSELPMVTWAERERIEREWTTAIEVDSITT